MLIRLGIFLIYSNLICVSTSLLKPLDLTWNFDENTVYWIGARPFEFTKMTTQKPNESYWYAANEFCAAEHGGTHLDAPYHFHKEGLKAGDIALERLITHGVVVDISEEALNSDPFINLECRHLTKWKEEHGEFKNNTVVLVKTGWSKYYHDKRKYFGLSEDNTTLNFPGISVEAARYLVDTKKVVGVGVDVSSVDPGKSVNYETHRLLSRNNIYLLENVKLKEDLPARNFTLLVMPMKIRKGTGAPLRLIAVPNDFSNF